MEKDTELVKVEEMNCEMCKYKNRDGRMFPCSECGWSGMEHFELTESEGTSCN